MRNTRGNLMMRGAQVCYAPDEPTGGESTGGQDNNQGNNGTQNNLQETQDNSSNGFDASKFWEEPVPPEDKSSRSATNGNAADSTSDGTGEESKGSKAGEAFMQQMANLKFGGDVFTTESLTALSEGKPESLNTAFATGLKDAVGHSVRLAAQLMQSYGETLMSQMDQKIQDSFGNRDSQGILEKEFPQLATNPGLKPMIQGIFSQSMKHSGNDRTKAVALTKDMLKYMGKNARDDFGIEEAPRGPNEGMTDNSKGLVSFLLDRGP